MYKIALTVLCMLSVCGHIMAGSCGTVTYSYNKPATYVNKTIYAVPVLAELPAVVFQYIPPTVLPTVVPAVQATVVNPAPVPVQQVVVKPNQQASYSQADLDRIIKEKVEAALQAKNVGFATDDGPPAIVTDYQPVFDNSPTNTATTKTGDLAMLQNLCAKCHTEGSKTLGGVYMFDQYGSFKSNTAIKNIESSILTGSMPKDRKLTDTEKQLLISYLRTLPNN